jgi:hypothetical protein
MLARGVDAADKGRIRDGPAATEQRQGDRLADGPVAVLHEVDEQIEHLHQACDRQKEIARGRPNGRYRLNELSSTSTSQIKHGAKSSSTCERTLANIRRSSSPGHAWGIIHHPPRIDADGPRVVHFVWHRPHSLNNADPIGRYGRA